MPRGVKRVSTPSSKVMDDQEIVIWTKEATMMLIELFKSRRELWDAHSKYYRNRHKRVIALDSIADQLTISSEEVSRKLHNLRCQFNSELRKMKNDIKPFNSKWEYFNHLKFMYYPEELNDSEINEMEINGTELIDQMDASNVMIEDVQTLLEKPIVIDTKPMVDDLFVADHSPKKLDSTSISAANPFQENTETCFELVRKPKDEFQIFGDFVAQELRSINSKDKMRKLKRKILREILVVSGEDDMECSKKLYF